MTIPVTLVQHVQYATSGSVDNGNHFKTTIPNPTLFQNCWLFKVAYPSTTKWIRVTDNLGTVWPPQPTISVTDTTNGAVVGIYIMPAMPAGLTTIWTDFGPPPGANGIMNFSPAFMEWAGIDIVNVIDGTPTSTFNQANVIASGSVTTAVANSAVFQIAQATDFGPGNSGFSDNITIFDHQTGTFIQTDPQNTGYFCQYQIQATPGPVNPGANAEFSVTPGAYGFCTITFALKANTSAGTLPSPIGTRVVGAFHMRFTGTGAAGNLSYAAQWPTFGNLLVAGCSDPFASIQIVGITGNVSGAWNVITTSGEDAQMLYKTNATNSTNEVLSITINDKSVHLYVQGIWWDIINGGAFDTSNITVGSTGFGPGNSTPVAPITPGVNTGITVVYWGLQSGPADLIVTPPGAFLGSGLYTGYTDTSTWDNGDTYAYYIFNTNATQNWVLHDTVTTAGFSWTGATFAGTLQPQAPTKFYGNGAMQANVFVEGSLSGSQITKIHANTTAEVNSMAEISGLTRTKVQANGQIQTPQFLEFRY